MRIYKAAFFLFLLICSSTVRSQDSMAVILNKQQFMPGDSLHMEVTLTSGGLKTIQLWIESIETGRRWKYRYPLIDGYLNASLKIDKAIPRGRYALNFLLQKDFFNIEGKVLNEKYKDKSINYLMVSKEKQSVIAETSLQPDGSFSTRHFLFKDTAFFIFSPARRNRENNLNIHIKTSLDSAFTPALVETKIISIGNIDTAVKQDVISQQPYSFKLANKDFKILSEVVVVSKSKKMIEQFEKENVNGLFSGGDAIVFDGLSNDDLANTPDLFTFLQSHLPGLMATTDSEGQLVLMWRKSLTAIYINEIRATDFSPYDINPADIAMIKVFRPIAILPSGSGEGGAVAIYTKRGGYEAPSNRKYSFYLRGYNALEEVWK